MHLMNRIESLPGGPQWKAKWITLPEAPNDPQLLLYHDPVECLEWLEANPEFEGEKDHAPRQEFLDPEMRDRCYGDAATAECWHELQKNVPDGVTVMPGILTTDSTHLTNFSGDKKIKPLLITQAHIRKNVRSKPSQRAFLLVAYILEGKFPHLEFEHKTHAKEMPGILSRRLFHVCMKHILAPLIPLSKKPKLMVAMVDSAGNLGLEMVFITTYISDLPEQALNACLAPNQCVPCDAGTEQLGNDKPCAPRTGESILKKIKAVRRKVGPNASTWQFAQAAKAEGLNGVEAPWWEDFPGLDICKIICPDVLHGLHKAFKDHCATWNINLVGKLEMDTRFKYIPKYTGFRHFSGGISKISQWSGKEHRDLQRVFLAVIAGSPHVPIEALQATRAEIDFIYLAQYFSHTDHTDSTLNQLVGYNASFHKFKNIFITTEARRGKNGVINHFHIPKLHTRHHYPAFI
jgi:hypothetical protein